MATSANVIGGVVGLGLLWSLLRAAGGGRYFATTDDLSVRPLPGGVPVYLRLDGPWTRGQFRRAYFGEPFKPAGCILHWPGNSLGRQDLLDDYTARHLSLHFTVGLDGITQWLPLDVAAYHATDSNRHTIGWEIAQPESDLSRARAWGFDVRGVPGTDYVTLDERLVRINVALIRALHAQLGWRIGTRAWRPLTAGYYGAPPVSEGSPWGRKPAPDWIAEGVTVMCHGDVPSNRADPWAWYPQIAEALRK